MAHNLATENGQASFMFVGEPAWHGLGTKLDEPPTAAEAIKAASLDWSVTKVPIYINDGKLSMPVKNRFGVVRQDKWGTDECPVFGIVGEDYTPLQNSEAFDFFDALVGEKKAAIYHTAGALGQGERVWILAKLPDNIRVVGDDIAEKYLLLSNSHDGFSSVQIRFTPIRVVCQNTLTMALEDGRNTIRIPHIRDLHNRIKGAEKLLGIINTRFSSIETTFKRMAKFQVNTEQLAEYISNVVRMPSDIANEKAAKRVLDDREAVTSLFDSGRGNAEIGVKGTLWAAYNGITEFVDYKQQFRSQSRQSSNSARVNNMWFGSGYLTKAKAYKVAVEKMHEWRN